MTAGAISAADRLFSIHYRASAALGVWMTPWKRDIRFGAAVLDLAAWGMLVACATGTRDCCY